MSGAGPSVRLYAPDGTPASVCTASPAELEGLARSARDSGGFLWVGLEEPSGQQLLDIGKRLGLHVLAVTDAIEGRQQPKVQWFPEHLFVVLWDLVPSAERQGVGIVETFLFARPGLLVTVRRGVDPGERADVGAMLDAAPAGRGGGTLTGVHAIVAHVIAGYLAVARAVETELEALEEEVFDPAAPNDPARLYGLRRRIGKTDRAVSAIAVAFREGHGHLSGLARSAPGLEPFVQDLMSDLRGVHQLTSDQRSALDGVISTHENSVASQQNADSRKISAVAAMLAIPAVVAGLYGTNLTNVPGTDWAFGWVAVGGAIVLLESAAVTLLRRRGWF